MNMTDNSKIFHETKNGYLINYIVSVTSYPYYLLTEINVYKDNKLCINITSDVRAYDDHILGNEYKSIKIETLNQKRIIEFNCINVIIGDRVISDNNSFSEIGYYEDELFDGNIVNFFFYNNRKYGISIENKKSLFKRLLRK